MRTFILCAALCLGVVGCKEEVPNKTVIRSAREAPPPPSAPFDGKTRHEFGNFSFVVPAGWVVVTPELDMTKALIMEGGSEWPGAKAMIKIDTQDLNVASPKEMAAVFATNTAGTVLPDPFDFDGTPGAKADASADLNTSQRHMFAIFRDNLAYSLTANSAEGVSVADAIELVRTTWKWKVVPAKTDEPKTDEPKTDDSKIGESKTDDSKTDGQKSDGN